jgi:hypothetical protein
VNDKTDRGAGPGHKYDAARQPVAMQASSRRAAALLGLALAVSSCRQPGRPQAPPAAAPMAMGAAAPAKGRLAAAKSWFTPSPPQQPGVHLAYSHTVALQVAAAARCGRISPRRATAA